MTFVLWAGAELAVLASVEGQAGWFVSECLEERREPGVADRVAGMAEAGGEGVTGERMAVPAQPVPCCASCRQEHGDVGCDAGDWSRLGSGPG